jgi:hypothetical protein
MVFSIHIDFLSIRLICKMGYSLSGFNSRDSNSNGAVNSLQTYHWHVNIKATKHKLFVHRLTYQECGMSYAKPNPTVVVVVGQTASLSLKSETLCEVFNGQTGSLSYSRLVCKASVNMEIAIPGRKLYAWD